jgi:DNA invertase Pin-like site-specific DNA recombinase
MGQEVKTLSAQDAELFENMDRLLLQIQNMPDNTLPKPEARRAMLGLPSARYLRVSSERQGLKYGVPSQRRDIDQACARYGFEPPLLEYKDEISAAGKLVRTDFKRMLAEARAGRFKVLFVGRIDRFGRDETAGWLYVRQLVLAGVTVFFCDETEDLAAGLDCNWQDTFSRGIQASAALVRLIRRNISKSVTERHAAGIWVGNYAFGWKGGANGNPEADPEQMPAVRRAVAILLEDRLTCGQIADALTAEGFAYIKGRRFTKNNVLNMLRNPLLDGDWPIYVNDPARRSVLRGRATPILRPGERERINEILGGRARRERRPQLRRPDYVYIFDHLLRCGENTESGEECGSIFSAHTSVLVKGQPGQYPNYGHSRGKGCCAAHCNQTWYVAERTLAGVFDQLIAHAHLPLVALDHIGAYLAEQAQSVAPNRDALLRGYQADLDRIDLAFRRGAYVREGDAAASMWDRERAAILARIEQLPPPPVLPTPEEIAVVRDLPEIWTKATASERRDILTIMFSAIYITRDGGPRSGHAGRVLTQKRQSILRLEARPEYRLLVAYAFGGFKKQSVDPLRLVATKIAPDFLAWLFLNRKAA